MGAPDVRVPGVGSIPAGYIIGRLQGEFGPALLLDPAAVAAWMASYIPTPVVAPPGITQLTGDVAAGPGSGSQVATLANTAVTPGSYTLTSLTVDAKGRITAASSGSAGTAPNGMLPLVTGDTTPGSMPFPIADSSGQFIGVPL